MTDQGGWFFGHRILSTKRENGLQLAFIISPPHISKRNQIIIAAIITIMIIIGRSLLGKEELAQEGCMIFSAILKYMGDLPSRSSFTLDIQSRLYHLV